MPNRTLTASAIANLIAGLSDRHILKRSPEQYIDGFISAALSVYHCQPLNLFTCRVKRPKGDLWAGETYRLVQRRVPLVFS